MDALVARTFLVRTNGIDADCEGVWSWPPDAEAKFASTILRAMGARKPGPQGERAVSRNPSRRECRMIRLHLWFLPRAFLSHGGHGCGLHPAFPAPLCGKNLPECANGRLDQNRPSLELSPLRPKAMSLLKSVGQLRCLPQPEQLQGPLSPYRARKGVDHGTK